MSNQVSVFGFDRSGGFGVILADDVRYAYAYPTSAMAILARSHPERAAMRMARDLPPLTAAYIWGEHAQTVRANLITTIGLANAPLRRAE